ncbi:Peptidase family M20 M25 M40 M42 glutamyl aminopeptidase Peptidase dimerization domain [Trypanosoma vivax]|uniref:Putative aminotripeptidase n=1 Tax=Trypanosoma vivax (strain Y486) TaxID=1055687 RepID=G0TZ97_TRYVY|nr:Peptidase family M20 M25 M40 M42 glutamyl aminopeptidase Peptidase dimerization domain [Trypanosoma vivax]CCC49300.1 putative aminotripeptidase [Trypanosoma vivax Y486]
MSGKSIECRLEERFMRYSAISSQSDAALADRALPTSPGQQELAELIAAELQAIGLEDVVCDNHATVTAVKRGRVVNCPTVGFIVHLDTVDVGLSPVVRAQKIRYEGGDVCLNKEKDIWLRVAEHPEIERYVGQDILFSDGTSVLGADDKAAIAVVVEMVAGLGPSDDHGDIVVCCVPDEEIGLLGAKNLDIKGRFNVDFAYTIDCCELGEVVYENFNAARARITFTGVTAHPMSAKGVLVNPLLMAMDYVAHFNRNETPECTAGRDGYWWFADMHANQNEAVLDAMVREFDADKFESRKRELHVAAQEVRQRYPTGRVEVTVADQYRNISNFAGENHDAVNVLFEALQSVGVRPKVTPMRGGTDGAVLSARGVVTPNYFTGAHNFHSRMEFLPVPSFVKSYEVTRSIVLLAAKLARARR